MQKIRFSWQFIKEWSPAVWAFFICVIALPVTFICYHVLSVYFFDTGLLFYIAKVFCGELCFLGAVTFILGSSWQFYIHHYMIALVSIPLVCY